MSYTVEDFMNKPSSDRNIARDPFISTAILDYFII